MSYVYIWNHRNDFKKQNYILIQSAIRKVRTQNIWKAYTVLYTKLSQLQGLIYIMGKAI